MSPRRLFHPDDTSVVLPGAAAALADLRARNVAHRYVRHVRSSQAFALNLFAPLQPAGVTGVFEHLGHSDVVAVDTPVFEFEDPSDRLGEASARSPHRTQVDVLLRGTSGDGRRIAALIEVKLGETNFGTCSAFASAENPDPDACGQPGLFGGDHDRCFQLSNHGRGHRAYATYLADVPIIEPDLRSDGGGCWLRAGRSQPMRNLALAQMLVAEGDVDVAVFAMAAPLGHTAIWRRFGEFTSMFCDTEAVTIRSLPAHVVAAAHADAGSAFRAKYPPVGEAQGTRAS